jgi:hypothetical protein
VITIIVLWILLAIIAIIVILLHFSVTVEICGGTDTKLRFKIKYMFFTLYPRSSEKSHRRKKSHTEKNSGDNEFSDSDEELFGDSFGEGEISEGEDSEEQSENADYSDFFADEDSHEDKHEEFRLKEKASDENSGREKSHREKSSGGRLGGLKRKYNFIKPYIPMGWKYFKKLLKAVRFTETEIEIVTGKEDAYESAMRYGKIQGGLFNLLALLSGIFTVSLKKADVNCVFNEDVLKANGKTAVRVRPSTVIAIAVCVIVNFLRMFLPDFLRKRKAKKKALKNKRNKIKHEMKHETEQTA